MDVREENNIDLSTVILTNEVCELIANELITNSPPIEMLTIGDQADDLDLSPIFDALRYHPTLKSLSVMYGTNSILDLLGELLRCTSSIRILYLWPDQSCILPDLSSIAMGLRSNSSIRRLDIRGDIFHISPIVDILKENTSIRALHLYNNQISDISLISEGLSHNSSITDLGIIENLISDVSPIAKALLYNSSLKTLSLGFNLISDVSSIGEALHHNVSLEVLRLGGNRIRDLSPIARALHHNTTLKLLDFERNDIRDVGPIGEALRCNSSLEVLDFNFIREIDISPIFEALEYNYSLTKLHINTLKEIGSSFKDALNMLSRNSLNLPKRRTSLYELMLNVLE